jgi:hypothetical protein
LISTNKLAFTALCIALALGAFAGCQPAAENQTSPPPPPADNSAPVIINLQADPSQLEPHGTALITCDAKDPDGDNITYSWKASQGSLAGSGDKVTWTAPDNSGSFTITVTAADGKEGGISTKAVTVTIPEKPNNAPVIAGIKYTRPGHSPITIKPDMTEREKDRTPDPLIRQYETADISCLATDADNDALEYKWYSIKGKGATVQWIAPSASYAQNGICTITCNVSDGRGGSATFHIDIIVKCCGV